MRWDGKAWKLIQRCFFSFLVSFPFNTKNYYFFIEFSSSFSHRLKFCQRLANRLLSLLFMKLYFIDFSLLSTLVKLHLLPSSLQVFFLRHHLLSFIFFIVFLLLLLYMLLILSFIFKCIQRNLDPLEKRLSLFSKQLIRKAMRSRRKSSWFLC